MSDGVDNLVLEQLRLIRDEMRVSFARVEDRLETFEAKADGTTAMLVGLGKYIHDLDTRVGHIGRKLGIET